LNVWIEEIPIGAIEAYEKDRTAFSHGAGDL
jgi:hypothetical protein